MHRGVGRVGPSICHISLRHMHMRVGRSTLTLLEARFLLLLRLTEIRWLI